MKFAGIEARKFHGMIYWILSAESNYNMYLFFFEVKLSQIAKSFDF